MKRPWQHLTPLLLPSDNLVATIRLPLKKSLFKNKRPFNGFKTQQQKAFAPNYGSVLKACNLRRR